jgi:hypothetical protein
MPRGIFKKLCHVSNLGSPLIIIMDDGDQYFQKKIMSNFFHYVMFHILING